MIFPCYFLDALLTAMQLHLDLQYDILVNDGLWGVSRHLSHDVGEIFGRNVHQVGIIIDIS